MMTRKKTSAPSGDKVLSSSAPALDKEENIVLTSTALLQKAGEQRHFVQGPKPDQDYRETIYNAKIVALLVQGMMLDDSVIRGFMNAFLADPETGYWRKGVRCFCTQFFPHIEARSFQDYMSEYCPIYNKWTGDMDPATDLVILIPIFTGPSSSGHFTTLICDRTHYSDGIFFFLDSYTGEDVANAVENEIQKIPQLWKSGSVFVRATCSSERAQKVHGKQPTEMVRQEKGSNDCGVFTCQNFRAFLHFLDTVDAWDSEKRKTLSIEAASAVSIKVIGNGSAKFIVKAGRRLIERSFSTGTVDPKHRGSLYQLAVVGYN